MDYTKVFVGVAGSCAVIAAMVITQTAVPLWGLVLVCFMIGACDKDNFS